MEYRILQTVIIVLRQDHQAITRAEVRSGCSM